MYNDAGVSIYAYKSDGMQKNMQTTDGELDYLFNVAPALGATHTTMELPAGPDGEASSSAWRNSPKSTGSASRITRTRRAA